METQLIAALRRRLPSHAALLLGPGDDAALLQLAASGQALVTVDLLTDSVDFQLDRVDPRRVGHKALAVNLSDIAAMAGRPMAAFVAVALPRRGGQKLAMELFDGMLPLAERYHVTIAGGDTNSWDGPLVISITVVGEPTARGTLRRGGARASDLLVATGSFGGSILGRHFDFLPRVDEALVLHERYELHAGIDVSDGLALDGSRLAQESGVGLVIHTAAVPMAPAAHEWAAQLADGSTPLDHALADGEDFELLLAVPPEEARRMVAQRPVEAPLTIIGEFIAERGLWQLDSAGTKSPLEPRGYQHRLD